MSSKGKGEKRHAEGPDGPARRKKAKSVADVVLAPAKEKEKEPAIATPVAEKPDWTLLGISADFKQDAQDISAGFDTPGDYKVPILSADTDDMTDMKAKELKEKQGELKSKLSSSAVDASLKEVMGKMLHSENDQNKHILTLQEQTSSAAMLPECDQAYKAGHMMEQRAYAVFGHLPEVFQIQEIDVDHDALYPRSEQRFTPYPGNMLHPEELALFIQRCMLGKGALAVEFGNRVPPTLAKLAFACIIHPDVPPMQQYAFYKLVLYCAQERLLHPEFMNDGDVSMLLIDQMAREIIGSPEKKGVQPRPAVEPTGISQVTIWYLHALAWIVKPPKNPEEKESKKSKKHDLLVHHLKLQPNIFDMAFNTPKWVYHLTRMFMIGHESILAALLNKKSSSNDDKSGKEEKQEEVKMEEDEKNEKSDRKAGKKSKSKTGLASTVPVHALYIDDTDESEVRAAETEAQGQDVEQMTALGLFSYFAAEFLKIRANLNDSNNACKDSLLRKNLSDRESTVKGLEVVWCMRNADEAYRYRHLATKERRAEFEEMAQGYGIQVVEVDTVKRLVNQILDQQQQLQSQPQQSSSVNDASSNANGAAKAESEAMDTSAEEAPKQKKSKAKKKQQQQQLLPEETPQRRSARGQKKASFLIDKM